MATRAATAALPDTRTTQRVARLDGIRGFCALGVLLTHTAFVAGLIGSFDEPPTNPFWAAAINGLTISLGPFFVLSGLLLYRSFAKVTLTGAPRPDLKVFFLRRALRLLPTYYAVTAFCLLLLNLDSIDSAWYVLRPIVFLQAYDPNWQAGMDVTWTVPAEIQFYLALPLLAWAGHKFAQRATGLDAKAGVLMILPAIMIVASFAWVAHVHMGGGMYPPEYFWPFSQAGLFGIGMILAVLSIKAEQRPERLPALHRAVIARPGAFWAAALVLYVVNCTTPFGRAGYGDFLSTPGALVQTALYLGVSFLVILPLQVPGVRSRVQDLVLANPVSSFLGRISYGIYLWHFPVYYLWFANGSVFGSTALPVNEFRGVSGALTLIVVTVLGSIALATASYYLLEVPAQRISERLGRGRAHLSAVPQQRAGGDDRAPDRPGPERARV